MASSVAASPRKKDGGYLVFELSRNSYVIGDNASNQDVEQSYKIHLNDAFLAEFKNLPNPHSSGTGLNCSGGESTRFSWWIRYTSQRKQLSVNMWAAGSEKLGDKQIGGRNPSVSQYVRVSSWKELNMTYQLSFSADPLARNVSFSVHYVPASEAASIKDIPFASVQRAKSGGLLVSPTPLTEIKFQFGCMFQEG